MSQANSDLPPIKIAPSMLNSDYAHLADQVAILEEAGVDTLHIDVADAHFAPNIMLGPRFVEVLRSITDLPIDCHLMMTDPKKYAPVFIKAGANLIFFHIEAVQEPFEVIGVIKGGGAEAAVALRPGTSANTIAGCIGELSAVMAMTVQPGFSGQKFMEEGCCVIPEIRKLAPMVDIFVDGGVNTETISTVVKYGANVIVAATAIFGKGDIVKAVRELRESAQSVRTS